MIEKISTPDDLGPCQVFCEKLKAELRELREALARERTTAAEHERALELRADALVDLVNWLDRRCGLGLDARLRIAQVLREHK